MTKMQKILLILGAIPVEPSRKMKRDCMKEKVNRLEENSKKVNIRKIKISRLFNK